MLCTMQLEREENPRTMIVTHVIFKTFKNLLFVVIFIYTKPERVHFTT